MLNRVAALTQTLPPSIRRRLPLLAKAAGTLGVLWLLGWLALPLVLKPQLERLAGEALGRTVQVDAVHFRPWTLELEVLGLRVGKAAKAGAYSESNQNGSYRISDEESQLSIQRIYVDAELSSLLRLAPVVDAVQ
ncbi:MAG: hypothetical protein K2W33_04605, partial [Burkholderiales bacterium]|nr:hypothetical protein [Burkholderiales bacterium]